MNRSISALLMGCLFSASTFANWALVKDESQITFTSIKKGSVAEVHTFTEFAGEVLKDGTAAVDINLASAETNIEIRNERLDTLLFNVEKFAGSRVKGMVDVKAAMGLKVGQAMTQALDLSLYLHGISKEVKADVQVVKLADNKFQVTSLKPVIINAADYSLVEGVEALRKVAGLPSIALAVPVTFNLVFAPK